jgi:hypothetical protein
MTRTPLILLATALVALSSGCRQQLATPAPVPATDADCNAVQAPQHVARHYRTAMQQLAAGRSPRQVAKLRCFIGNQAATQADARVAYRQLVAHTFNPDILYTVLQRQLQRNLEADRTLGQQRDAQLAWPGAYLSEAAVVAYRNTGQQRFLDLFVTYYDGILERRDDQLGRFDTKHKRVMKAWGSVNIEKDQWIAHVTHNARITYPATEFARLVRANPSLQRFQAKADRYVASARETLDDFEDDLVSVPGHPEIRWYQRPLDNNLEATNHLHVVGNTWLNLASLTGEARYRRHVEEVIEVFLQGVRREPDGLVSWNYFPFFAEQERRNNTYLNGQEYSEPIWKASLTAPFLLRAQAQGYAVPHTLIEALGRTFTSLTFQGDQIWRNLARRDSRFVDPQKDRQKLGFLRNATVLVEYGRVAPDLPTKVATLVASRPDLFPQGWLSSPSMLLSYAYYLTPPRKPQPTH